MTAEALLRQWAAVTRELTELLDAALDVEPVGGCPDAWAARLARAGATPHPEADRLAAVRRGGQTKGALLDEVEACLEAFARDAAARLSPLRAGLTPTQAQALDEALRTLTAHALAHYRALATEKKRMLGAAKALAAQRRSQSQAGVSGYVLTCSTCRAPRLGEALTCAFCGGALEAIA
jgi:hypothetical protein